MNGEGQALVSGAFVDQLTQGPNSALSGCSEPPQQQRVSNRSAMAIVSFP
jgi:hypothetical protein